MTLEALKNEMSLAMGRGNTKMYDKLKATLEMRRASETTSLFASISALSSKQNVDSQDPELVFRGR